MAKSISTVDTFVYTHWTGMKEPVLMGILKAISNKGGFIFSFSYDDKWLKRKDSFYLDPNLQFYGGPQYPSAGKENFGIFLDSSPDRWGKLLMRRREAVLARKEGRREKQLTELDYLLGVFDKHRMGALRFKANINGPFLNDNKQMASPPWAALRDLEYASLQLEKKDAVNDPEYIKWLTILVAPGSSLGGARPKASVVDTKGQLWIAKFPSGADERNIGGWEKTAQLLAEKCGVIMAEGQAKKFNSKYHTFLNRRFDRTKTGERVHFASAMTLLGYNDGADYKDGISYLELAEFISRHGAQPDIDIRQLWKRIVFYMCISNTDDHLRNHGFLLSDKGWILSPAYDINPEPLNKGLTLNISETDNSLELDLAREVAESFRLNKKQAEKIIEEVTKAVSHWRTVATTLRISKEEQDSMASAFITK